MAYITQVTSAFPPFTLTKAEMLELFQHPIYNYSKEVLNKIQRILAASDIVTRPTAVNLKQFHQDLDEEKPPCLVTYPAIDNVFRKSGYNPSITDRAIVWEQSVKVRNAF